MGYLLFQLRTHRDYFQGEESEDVPALSLSGALACLVVITLIVAVCSGAHRSASPAGHAPCHRFLSCSAMCWTCPCTLCQVLLLGCCSAYVSAWALWGLPRMTSDTDSHHAALLPCA
jgi:hypothetical protein